MPYALLRRSVFFLATLLVLLPALAAAPLPDYTHTIWRADDGAPVDIRAMAQTPDGMLWLGTPNGLYRFDGIGFKRYRSPSARALGRVDLLAARPDGALWIADDAGMLYVLRDGKLGDVTPPPRTGPGIAASFAFEADGSAWVAGSGGVWRFAGGRWQGFAVERDPLDDRTPRAAADLGVPEGGMFNVLADQYGRIWASGPHGVYQLDRAAQRFRKVVPLTRKSRLIQSPDGRIWAIRQSVQAGEVLADVVAAPPPAALPALARPARFNQAESRGRGQFDRDGNLWVVDCKEGACLVAGAGKDAAAVPMPSVATTGPALGVFSAPVVNCVLEDSAGNLWFGTQAGLDRLRANKVVRVPIGAGKSSYTMAQDTEGHAWLAEAVSRRVWKILEDGSVEEDRTRPIAVVANDRDGALIMAGQREIVRRLHGVETTIPLPPTPDGKHVPLDIFGLRDDGETLWIGAAEFGIAGLQDGAWHYRDHWNFPRGIYTSAPAGKGKLWLAMMDGTVILWERGRQTVYGAGAIGRPVNVHQGPDVLAAGDEGMSVLQNGRFRMLQAPDPEVLRSVSGVGITPDGDRWLNGARGIVHVRAADWRAAMADPRLPLRYALIDAHDGYPGHAMLESRLHSVFTRADGRMWFMTSSGVVQLDPRRLATATVPPVVAIGAVQAGGHTYPGPRVRLPAGSQDFSIAYGGPSLSRADGLRFQYLLDGRDDGWQDGGTRRTAWYTNIAPGHYTFRVRAVNEDGVASTRDAATVVVIEPTVTQSAAFRIAMLVCAALALYGLYRYRLGAATRRIADRHAARLAERERIARTLHDTFLQSVQGLVLRVHAAARRLPPDDAVRRQLEEVLDQADDTLAEGRNQVHELRSGRNAERVLEETGRILAATFPATDFDMAVTGERGAVRSQVEDELAEIGAEALRNAFAHARARRVSLRLDYGREVLALHVDDDGVGFDDDTRRARAREGHWGLVGMRERAVRIGARLSIDGAPGRGTRVTLEIAARLAYDGQPAAA